MSWCKSISMTDTTNCFGDETRAAAAPQPPFFGFPPVPSTQLPTKKRSKAYIHFGLNPSEKAYGEAQLAERNARVAQDIIMADTKPCVSALEFCMSGPTKRAIDASPIGKVGPFGGACSFRMGSGPEVKPLSPSGAAAFGCPATLGKRPRMDLAESEEAKFMNGMRDMLKNLGVVWNSDMVHAPAFKKTVAEFYRDFFAKAADGLLGEGV